MKTHLLYISIIFLILIQNTNAQDVNFGMFAGVNETGIVGREKPATKMRLGYNGGFYLESNFEKGQSFQVELNYLYRKYSFSEAIPSLSKTTLNVSEKRHYLSVPIRFKLTKVSRKSKTFIDFGIQSNFLIYKTDTLSAFFKGVTIDARTYYNYEDAIFEYGATLGGGVQKGALIFRIESFISLNNMFKGDNAREMRFFDISANVGYQFNYVRPRAYNNRRNKKGFFGRLRNMF